VLHGGIIIESNKSAVLDCQDRHEWMWYFDRLANREKDIHWLPEYIEAHAINGTGHALVTLNKHHGVSMIPYVNEGRIVSPYGYGAILGGGEGLELTTLSGYRFHPLIGQKYGVADKDVVLIDLTKEFEFSKGHSAAIKKAEQSGVKVTTVEPTKKNVASFCQAYYATLDRQNAAEGWWLVDDHFERMAGLMGNRFALFFAEVNGKVESACIVLHGFQFAYYHFAGSFLNYPKLGVNHFMVSKVAQWAKDAGYAWLHLGGGVTSDIEDRLRIFKCGFSKVRLPVFTFG
jgi:Acetyltransferase (GNAT) domain